LRRGQRHRPRQVLDRRLRVRAGPLALVPAAPLIRPLGESAPASPPRQRSSCVRGDGAGGMSIPEAVRARDLVGYGRTPPKWEWPEGARVSFNLVLVFRGAWERWVF